MINIFFLFFIFILVGCSSTEQDSQTLGAINHNGTTYYSVVSPYTGIRWLDRNLGAHQVCTKGRDEFNSDEEYTSSQERCFGDYYQFGRNADGHEKSNSSITTTFATNVIDVGHGSFIVDGMGDWSYGIDPYKSLRIENWSKTDGTSICPIGYRVPTKMELDAEITDTSAPVHNNIDAFNHFLRLPSSGRRSYYYGTVDLLGTYGHLWTNTLSVTNDAHSFSFYATDASTYHSDPSAMGLSVRCIQDLSTIPDPDVPELGVKKTGQTKSYDTFGTESTDGSIKDDGHYQKGISPRYTRSSDIVSDDLTNLMWQDNTEVQTVRKEWQESQYYNVGDYYNTSGDTATTYCNNLNLGGYTDWRLPTIKELENIIDYSESSHFDVIFQNMNTMSTSYWSSNTYMYDGWVHNAWIAGYTSTKFVKTQNLLAVRCVRGTN